MPDIRTMSNRAAAARQAVQEVMEKSGVDAETVRRCARLGGNQELSMTDRLKELKRLASAGEWPPSCRIKNPLLKLAEDWFQRSNAYSQDSPENHMLELCLVDLATLLATLGVPLPKDLEALYRDAD